jgi:hypothetical protein
MSWLINNKVVRVVLAVNVSFWMAGAVCLFGCSNDVSAHSERATETQVIVAGDSCASAHSHDCCAKPKARKTTPSQPADGFRALSSGMMKDCPLASNAAAAISKARGDTVDLSVVLAASTTRPESSKTKLEFVSPSPPPTNLGPIHLRCCVFLI